jgi:hypothetical protein
VDGRWIIPLPHPSGASRWHELSANRQRIRLAVELIARPHKNADRTAHLLEIDNRF